ncbi:hypothetical protein E4K10_18940 [Streptomyces sp. T1317-0309]|nr:hypothetical protein E4K10_18940 [Streptomyces sp. T1317-0309]
MQRLTTAPPWRHAARFSLSGPLVANPGRIGVSQDKTMPDRPSGSRRPHHETPEAPVKCRPARPRRATKCGP